MRGCLLTALDASRLLHAGKELLKLGVLQFKSSSIVRLNSLSWLGLRFSLSFLA
jgi:hypothetical protein